MKNRICQFLVLFLIQFILKRQTWAQKHDDGGNLDKSDLSRLEKPVKDEEDNKFNL